MSNRMHARSPGVFMPAEVVVLRNLLDDMRRECWFPAGPAAQERLAAYLINAYKRGVICPDQLRAWCAGATDLHHVSDQGTAAAERSLSRIEIEVSAMAEEPKLPLKTLDQPQVAQRPEHVNGDPGIGGLLADPLAASVEHSNNDEVADAGGAEAGPTPDPEPPQQHGDWAPNRAWKER